MSSISRSHTAGISLCSSLTALAVVLFICKKPHLVFVTVYGTHSTTFISLSATLLFSHKAATFPFIFNISWRETLLLGEEKFSCNKNSVPVQTFYISIHKQKLLAALQWSYATFESIWHSRLAAFIQISLITGLALKGVNIQGIH